MTARTIDPTTASHDEPRARPGGLLRVATAGSVDDGKSTLIGRLLLDSKAIFADQLEQVTATSQAKGHDFTDLALFTDGLRSEREQGITIDVAYRYFSTPARKFIIADTPGHVQYTRNMVTGASTADLGLVLVDAREGLTEQSRRHAVILSLLQVPHVVLAVNKMDLVGFEAAVLERIERDFADFAARLGLPTPTTVPISALHGDNVVERSESMPWYQGPTLLEHLESVPAAVRAEAGGPLRLPIQYVIRPQSDAHHDYRGYAGQVAGGVVRVGDRVRVMPSGVETSVAGIDLFEGEIEAAGAGLSVTVRLADDVDAARGDMIVPAAEARVPVKELEATICWMAEAPLRGRAKLALKHTTRSARAMVTSIDHRLDTDTLHRDTAAESLALNEIGRVRLKTAQPLVLDRYQDNRATGSFILVDEATGATVAAGMAWLGSEVAEQEVYDI